MPGGEIAISQDGEALDAVVWRKLGRTSGLVEATMALNPGLADLGPVLPGGTPVTLPPPSSAQPVRETVKLWG